MIEQLTTSEIFALDMESELRYHHHMSNQIEDGIITDPELLEQLSKLRYHESADTGVNPNFEQEWLSFITWEPDSETTGDTQRINELGHKLHNMTNELFPTYEGMYVGLCDNIDKLFSGETVRKLLSQISLGGGRFPAYIIYVPSRHKAISLMHEQF